MSCGLWVVGCGEGCVGGEKEAHLLDGQWDEKSRVARYHLIEHSLVALFVIYIVAPCGQGYGDGVRGVGRESTAEGDVGKRRRGRGHIEGWVCAN